LEKKEAEGDLSEVFFTKEKEQIVQSLANVSENRGSSMLAKRPGM